jgi:hypothetical protein
MKHGLHLLHGGVEIEHYGLRRLLAAERHKALHQISGRRAGTMNMTDSL